MGTFDNQCMITGITLDDVACLILIERPDGSHVPCALPIFGHRDPHGAIVGIEDHPAVDSLALGLAAAVDVGRLQLAVPSWLDRVDVSPDRTGLQNFVELFFRGGHALHAGSRLALTLIERHVWNAVSAAIRDPLPDVELSSVISPPDLVTAFYPRASVDTVKLASRFRAIQIWLAAREIEWRPLAAGNQFDEDDIQDLLRAAVERFREEPTIVDGLLEYARHQIDGSLTKQELLDGS
jgi:hypothetical protein